MKLKFSAAMLSSKVARPRQLPACQQAALAIKADYVELMTYRDFAAISLRTFLLGRVEHSGINRPIDRLVTDLNRITFEL